MNQALKCAAFPAGAAKHDERAQGDAAAQIGFRCGVSPARI
jgi:hypothetical protein